MHNFERLSALIFKCTTYLMLGIAFFYPLKLMADEQTVQPETKSSLLTYIDAPRDYVAGKFAGFASSVDRFFGDERNFQESNQSVLQIDLTKVAGYGGSRNAVLSGRAKWHLPSTQKRLHLLIESDPEQNVSGDEVAGTPDITDQGDTEGKVAIGARFEREQKARWHFSSDAGIQLRTPLEPFTRVRGSYSLPMDKWRMKVAESVFWFNTIGVGETTQVDFERILSEPALLRISSSATWLHEKQNLDWRQDASIYHTLSERSALLYQLSAAGITNPQWQLNEYVLLMLYRYRLHRKWIFFEISPQLHFPRDLNFKSNPTLFMRLEMLFDGSR